MVLGSADLRQEFAYVSQRPQWLAPPTLIGYGTVLGPLGHTSGSVRAAPEIVVASGVALSPRGQLIRVAPGAVRAAQTTGSPGRAADVNTRKQGTGPVFTLPLYVVLGYRSCDSDPVSDRRRAVAAPSRTRSRPVAHR